MSICAKYGIRLNLLANNDPHTRDRYFKHFGPSNRKISLGNHSLVLLDAPLLIEEDYRRAELLKSFEEWKADEHGSVEFIRSLNPGDGRKGMFEQLHDVPWLTQTLNHK